MCPPPKQQGLLTDKTALNVSLQLGRMSSGRPSRSTLHPSTPCFVPQQIDLCVLHRLGFLAFQWVQPVGGNGKRLKDSRWARSCYLFLQLHLFWVTGWQHRPAPAKAHGSWRAALTSDSRSGNHFLLAPHTVGQRHLRVSLLLGCSEPNSHVWK